jgi:universal stress protein A
MRMPREFKTILCPTDFSEDSYRAIDYGLRFAKAWNAALLIAHVIHMPTGELYEPVGDVVHTLTFDEARRRDRARLEEIRTTRLGGYAKCEILVEIGDPYQQLMAITQQRQVDLIVTATHGRSALEHLILGSVAEKIIRHAPCPVLVVRRGSE